jgi:hypothetical protein
MFNIYQLEKIIDHNKQEDTLVAKEQSFLKKQRGKSTPPLTIVLAIQTKGEENM